jgi:hypothetical protein
LHTQHIQVDVTTCTHAKILTVRRQETCSWR